MLFPLAPLPKSPTLHGDAKSNLCMFSLWAVGKQAGICGYFSGQERPDLVVTRVNPVLWRWRQEKQEFEANLGYEKNLSKIKGGRGLAWADTARDRYLPGPPDPSEPVNHLGPLGQSHGVL